MFIFVLRLCFLVFAHLSLVLHHDIRKRFSLEGSLPETMNELCVISVIQVFPGGQIRTIHLNYCTSTPYLPFQCDCRGGCYLRAVHVTCGCSISGNEYLAEP